MDTEGFPVSMDYGDYTWKITPNEETIQAIKSIPLEERWSKRLPDNFSTFNPNIKIKLDNWHNGVEYPTIANFRWKNELKRRRLGLSGNLPAQSPFSNITINDIIPNKHVKYISRPQHIVFSTDLENQPLSGFKAIQIGTPEKDFLNFCIILDLHMV